MGLLYGKTHGILPVTQKKEGKKIKINQKKVENEQRKQKLKIENKRLHDRSTLKLPINY